MVDMSGSVSAPAYRLQLVHVYILGLSLGLGTKTLFQIKKLEPNSNWKVPGTHSKNPNFGSAYQF